MPQTIEIVSHDDCTGCGACLNRCPKDAIVMQLDGDFPYPVIDHNRCVDCGLCERSCPALHPSFQNEPDPACYAYWAEDDVRAMSSSGGAFSVLAESVLARGGAVAGAAYSDDCYSAEYRLVERAADLAPLRGSKYVQADTKLVYRDAKRVLDEGRPVLFVGCPCEVAGMRGFLGREDPNLYCVDLVCHGTPPQRLYELFIRELERGRGAKATRVSFRDKAYMGWNPSTAIDFDNGDEYRRRRSECPYMRAFLGGLMFRESCGHCPFATLPRQGDLTIADFWDVHRYDPALDDRKGTSLLLVNNARGDELLKTLRDGGKMLERAPLEHAIKYNAQIRYSSMHNPRRTRFQSLMRDYGYPFAKAADFALRDHYDVGFVGWWYGANYGSALTAFALNRTLVSMGKSTLMLNWPMNPLSEDGSRGSRLGERFYDMADYVPIDQTSSYNDRCDAFVVGSDQLWNWYSNQDVGTYYFFLDWVDDQHKKIAYSTSFGHDVAYYPWEMRFRLNHLLSRFDFVSVREESAVEICRHDFGVEAVRTMDPVFLCDTADYDTALALSTMSLEDESYVLGYIMNPTPDKRDAVRRVAEELGLPYRILVDGQGDHAELAAELGDENLMEDVEIQDWLYLFRHARFVVTDSFHGLCFSLIFRRQLAVFINPLRGRARIDTLSAIAGIEERVFETYERFSATKCWETPIDYKRVASRIRPEVERSRAWLLHALDAKKKQPSAADTCYRKIEELERRINELETDCRGEAGSFKRYRWRVWGILRRGARSVREHGVRHALRRLREKVAARLSR